MKGLKVVANTGNAKLGANVAATYRGVGDTCPACPLLGNGCYAQRGRVGLIQLRAKDTDDSLDNALSVPLIRHFVSGDAFKRAADGRSILDREVVREIIDWHSRPAQRYTVGWGYTHRWQSWTAAGLGPPSWPKNLTILASVETIENKNEANAAGWKTARVVESVHDEILPDERRCPIDFAKVMKRPKAGINCANCRLCFSDEFTGHNIVFVKF